jgi:hypothetical protein
VRRPWEPKDLRTLVAVTPPYVDVEVLAVAVAANHPDVEVASTETGRTLLGNKRVTIRLSGDLPAVAEYRRDFRSTLTTGRPPIEGPILP